MNLKIQSLALCFAFLVIMYSSCDKNPGTPDGAGAINVNFQIVGHPVPGKSLLMKPTQSQVFTKVIIDVYSSGSAAVASETDKPVAHLELKLEPDDTTFEGKLQVPAGKQLVVARLYQADGISGINSAEELVFCGQQSVSIRAGSTTEVNIDLYAIPIKGRRVVIHIGTVDMTSDESSKFLPVSIANLDSLRGIQFDLHLKSKYEISETISIHKTERTASLSNINYSILSASANSLLIRILLYDRNEGAILLPVTDPCATPDPVIQLGFQLATETVIIDDHSLEIFITNALVTSNTFTPLEVWAVDGEINLNF